MSVPYASAGNLSTSFSRGSVRLACGPCIPEAMAERCATHVRRKVERDTMRTALTSTHRKYLSSVHINGSLLFHTPEMVYLLCLSDGIVHQTLD